MSMKTIRALTRGHAMAFLLIAGTALAEDKDKEPLAIIQLGGSGEWGLDGGGVGFGPTAAVEFAPIKNWLEVETGVSTLFSKGQTEWDYDFIFKKPFDLSPYVEFEPGLGPVWMHTLSRGRTTNAVGAETIAEFMFWPCETSTCEVRCWGDEQTQLGPRSTRRDEGRPPTDGVDGPLTASSAKMVVVKDHH